MMLHESPPVRLGKGICFRHSLAAVCYQLWVSIVGFARYLNKIVLQALPPQMKSRKSDTCFEGMEWEGKTKGNLYDEEEEDRLFIETHVTIIAAYKAELQSTIQAAFKLYYIEVL